MEQNVREKIVEKSIYHSLQIITNFVHDYIDDLYYEYKLKWD